MTTRRNFIIGAVAAGATINLPNWAALADPLVKGVRWQTWPFDAPHPKIGWACGSCQSDNEPRRLSHYMERLKRYQGFAVEPLYWEIIS